MNIKTYKDLIKRVQKFKIDQNLDLSSGEDLSIGIMNLISIEEHLFFTSQKTGDNNYFDLLNEVRKMRTDFLKEIIKDYEGEVWCFPPETTIFCNPEPKKINEISKDDRVLTHKGLFQPVERTYKREYNGKLTSIHPYYADPLNLTPGHEVLCATSVRRKQKDSWRKNFSQPEITWKKAGDLKPTDFLLFPRCQETKDVKELDLEYSWTNTGCFKPTTFKQTKRIRVNDKLLALIGLYISEGSTTQRRYSYKNSFKTSATLYFSFGKHETNLIRKTQRYFESVFKIPLKVSETKTTMDLVCSHRIIIKFFEQFGSRSKEKELPFWAIRLPNEKLFSLIWGLVKGDGMIDKYQISYFTSSEKLAYQLRILLFKMGILHSLKKINTGGGKIEGRKITASEGFEITISGDAARILDKNSSLKYKVKRTSGNLGYVLDNYVMIPIRKIENVDYSGPVYNLQTKSHTYTTFTGVVHNCISKHLLASSMRVMEVGTKELKKGNKEKARELFEKSYKLYSLFWGLVLSKNSGASELKMPEDKSVFSKLGSLVQKAIDCCKE